jgi:excisionase family DNA binding protein
MAPRVRQIPRIDSLPDLLTVREVAEILRVSPLTIKRWGKKGKLPPIRINSRGDRRYKKEAVLWLLGIHPKE